MNRCLTLIFSLFFASFIFAQKPIAQFIVNQTSVCAGFPITFTDQTNYQGKAIVSITWDFGEGGQSSDVNPTYTYVNPGVYQVLLTAISATGTDTELKLNYITVYPNPLALFSTSGNVCTVPFAVTFNNNSTVGAGINYNWDFGNLQTSILQNPPLITYNSAGTFPITLIVTNSVTGCNTTITKSLLVSDFATGISVQAIGCVGIDVPITDVSTVGVDSWSWSSGDGQNSILQNPTFTYPIAGTYTISLIAKNSVSNCSSTVTKDIVITNLPIPTFTAVPLSGCSPLDVTFTNTSGAGTYHWDFGDGTISNLKNPLTKTYSLDGSYSVGLKMTDVNGCKDSILVSDMITVAPPISLFGSDVISGCAPLEVNFSDSSKSSSPIDDPIVSWLWTFGDGSTFSGQTPPTHTYGIGTYDVSLTITTQKGCTITSLVNNYIQVGMVDLVDFTLFPIEECSNKDITFTNLSVISTPHNPNEVKYEWNFGDQGISTLKDPIYDYPVDTGFFDIQLVVDFRGCRDTLIRTDQIHIKGPISKFNVPSLYCNPLSLPVVVNVKDNAIAGATKDNVDMIWRWGDGTPDDFLNGANVLDSDKGNISHTYTAYGNYVIKQVIHNYTTGCEDSTEQKIYITSVDASFTLSNDTICNSLPVDLVSTSVFRDPDATFSYNMGNGDVIEGDSISYIYTTPGSYIITLTVTNSVGCADSSKFLTFKVLDPPVAQFTASADFGCLPITANYTNTSITQGNGVALSSFLWTYPDATTETTNNLGTPTHFDFTKEGLLVTNLVATDEFGCISPPATASMLITNPTVGFNVDPVVCDLENFTAINTTTGFGQISYKWDLDNTFATNTTDYSNSFDESPSNLYSNIDHNLKLIATDANGCKDSILKKVQVSLPFASLTYVASGATANGLGEYTCPPVFQTYTDQSVSMGAISSWAWSFGDGKSSTFQNPNNTYIFPGTYTLSLSIVDQYGCKSDTTLVDYLTILGPGGDLSWTTIDDLCLHKYEFSASNLTFADSIIWDLDDGDTIYNLHSFTHTYPIGSFNPTGSLIDLLGCKVVYPMDALVVVPISITADAGQDQSFCGISTVLEGNIDLNGVGVWTKLSGSGIILDPNSPTSTVTNIDVGLSKFIWTVSNSCSTKTDTVEIISKEVATIAAAGQDQLLCVNMTALEGNTALIGIGKWTLASGVGTITNPSDPLSGVTNLGIGLNKFVWTIENECTSNKDTVYITVETVATIADAGSDQIACIPNSVLEGNTPISGTGIWTLISGVGNITDPNLPNSGLTGLALGPNVFAWTISNTCGLTQDLVTITGVQAPTISIAGPPQFTCLTTANLHSNEAIVGTGNWSLISGSGVISNPLDSLSTVTGLSVGPNVFEWTITSFCGTDSDQVTITVETAPTIADAGPDQEAVCETSTFLVANTPIVGNGLWSLISGSGTITSPNSPTSEITNLGEGANVFKWTISNSCNTFSDIVTIVRFAPPTIATVTAIKPICSNSSILTGNVADVGTGVWSLISGSGIITSPKNPISDVTNLGVGINKFRWTIFNGCNSSFADVKITVETPPTIAKVGPNQVVCGTTAILDGKKPLSGFGTWTLVSGSGDINTAKDSTSGISNLGIGENVYKWTITNSCNSSSAQMTIINTGQCPDEDSLKNDLIYYVPNTFTPNGDPFNQTFQPIFTSGYEPLKYTLYIFDRWGELIFESHNADIGWKGTYGSDERKAQDGVYTWKIIFTEINTQKEHNVVGLVVLIR